MLAKVSGYTRVNCIHVQSMCRDIPVCSFDMELKKKCLLCKLRKNSQ